MDTRAIFSMAMAAALMLAAPRASAVGAHMQGSRAPAYATVFYTNDGLKLEAYVFTPPGSGPFPVVIYNHGSRAGNERTEQPFLYIGRMLTAAGYLVIVPERRGYGKSEGPTTSDEVGNDFGSKLITRLQEETGDALASLDYAKTLPAADVTHVAFMGWSHGGIVTTFGASRSTGFVAAIEQAAGSLSWNRSSALQKALVDAAAKITIPLLSMVAENDATTAAVKHVHDAAKSHGNASAMLIVYPPFTPAQNPSNTPPGHLIFGAGGASIWQNDALTFLAKYLKPTPGH